MSRRLLSALALALLALAELAGCPAPRERARQILPNPIGSVRVDSVADGELAEGEHEAFGLAIPRDMAVKARFPDMVHAAGSLPLEAVANYVRARVDAEHVETGPRRTVFERAVVKSAPQQLVHVEVTAQGGGDVDMTVRDETPLPFVPGLTEAERWKQAGMSPDGTRMLDPGE